MFIEKVLTSEGAIKKKKERGNKAGMEMMKVPTPKKESLEVITRVRILFSIMTGSACTIILEQNR